MSTRIPTYRPTLAESDRLLLRAALLAAGFTRGLELEDGRSLPPEDTEALYESLGSLQPEPAESKLDMSNDLVARGEWLISMIEGNEPNDLAEQIWERMSEAERASALAEIREQYATN